MKLPPIHSVLDIGANVGDWTKMARKVWPDARFHLIEANEGCEPYLRETGERWTIALLGAEHGRMERFYAIGPTATGASIYKESGTDLYGDCSGQDRMVTTLDYLFPLHQSGPDHPETRETFDLIKIDTQGSELDILRGGVQLVCGAKAVLLEVSIIEYNEGAPLISEVVQCMISIGFPRYEVVACNNAVYQMDLLFLREPC